MKQLSRFLLPILGAIIVLVALGLLVLLAVASANTEFFDRYYSLLYRVNLVVGVLLVTVVTVLVSVLLVRLRRGRFGTRLMTKLGVYFAIVGVLPGALIYLVSLQFVSRSIESWFDVKTETALEAGLNLGRAMMENMRLDLRNKTELMVEQLNLTDHRSDTALALALSRLQHQFDVQDATIFTGDKSVIATASQRYDVRPDLPGPSILRQIAIGSSYAAIEGLDDDPLSAANSFRLRIIVPLAQRTHKEWSRFSLDAAIKDEQRYLQVLQDIPATLAMNAASVEQAYAEYQLNALGRIGLRKMYIGTLTLTLLLVIFIAMVLALLLGRQLAQPLLSLLQGTKAVAEGDLSARLNFAGNDELSMLTQQFNQMTQQLADARTAVNTNRQALEWSKAYLESILTNLTAGVLVMDSHFIVTMANPGAERILRCAIIPLLGQSLDNIPGLKQFSAAVHTAFSEQEASAAGHWQQQIEMAAEQEDESLTLLARGTHLPGKQPGARGFVVVFDDMTDILSAQRALAWREVARRLAHEIKNPLTPIQLSAERLQMKLHDKLAEVDARMLERSVRTIVNQVQAMQHMVDGFRDYARLPAATMRALQLNDLIAEVLVLYGIDDAGDNHHPIIEVKLDAALPEIQGDPTQLRQVIHNLVQNALDAVAQMKEQAHVIVATEVVEYQLPANNNMRRAVKLSVSDNGGGFSSRLLGRAFEPYVTTKDKGTGLGLAMVKKISEEHGAKVELRNRPNAHFSGHHDIAQMESSVIGASVSVTFVKLA